MVEGKERTVAGNRTIAVSARNIREKIKCSVAGKEGQGEMNDSLADSNKIVDAFFNSSDAGFTSFRVFKKHIVAVVKGGLKLQKVNGALCAAIGN